MKLLSCSSNTDLAKKMADKLGVTLVDVEIKRFADQEIYVQINNNVRGANVFVVQSTAYPANDHIMELLVCIDALKRASAGRINAVIPYFGYARQDRKSAPRTPISAKLVADIIARAGADAVLTIDLHAMQIQGFFDIPVDNLYASPVFIEDIRKNNDLANLMIISPDVGALGRARHIAKKLNVELAVVDKRRERAGVSEVMNIIGDVKGRNCVILDDIVDSAGTLCNAAEALMKEGALSVSSYITHGVLSGKAVERVRNSALKELVITDSISITAEAGSEPKIRTVSVAPLLAEAIKRICEENSVSSLLEE